MPTELEIVQSERGAMAASADRQWARVGAATRLLVVLSVATFAVALSHAEYTGNLGPLETKLSDLQADAKGLGDVPASLVKAVGSEEVKLRIAVLGEELPPDPQLPKTLWDALAEIVASTPGAEAEVEEVRSRLPDGYESAPLLWKYAVDDGERMTRIGTNLEELSVEIGPSDSYADRGDSLHTVLTHARKDLHEWADSRSHSKGQLQGIGLSLPTQHLLMGLPAVLVACALWLLAERREALRIQRGLNDLVAEDAQLVEKNTSSRVAAAVRESGPLSSRPFAAFGALAIGGMAVLAALSPFWSAWLLAPAGAALVLLASFSSYARALFLVAAGALGVFPGSAEAADLRLTFLPHVYEMPATLRGQARVERHTTVNQIVAALQDELKSLPDLEVELHSPSTRNPGVPGGTEFSKECLDELEGYHRSSEHFDESDVHDALEFCATQAKTLQAHEIPVVLWLLHRGRAERWEIVPYAFRNPDRRTQAEGAGRRQQVDPLHFVLGDRIPLREEETRDTKERRALAVALLDRILRAVAPEIPLTLRSMGFEKHRHRVLVQRETCRIPLRPGDVLAIEGGLVILGERKAGPCGDHEGWVFEEQSGSWRHAEIVGARNVSATLKRNAAWYALACRVKIERCVFRGTWQLDADKRALAKAQLSEQDLKDKLLPLLEKASISIHLRVSQSSARSSRPDQARSSQGQAPRQGRESASYHVVFVNPGADVNELEAYVRESLGTWERPGEGFEVPFSSMGGARAQDVAEEFLGAYIAHLGREI